MSEHSEVCEGPKPIIKDECAIIDNSPKSTEEENAAAMMSIKEKIEDGSKAENKFEVSTSATDKKNSLEKEVEEREPEKEVCKESETAVSGAGQGNPDVEEHSMAGISNSSISDVTVKESIKEDESGAMKSTEEASNSNIEETAKPNNDPSLFDVVKETKEEIAPVEVKKDLACSSLVELEESKNDTEEETSVKGRTNTGDLEAKAEETNIKEAEAEEKKKEVNNVHAVEEKGLATTEHEGIGVDSADIDVNTVDSSITCEKEKEIPHGEDGMRAPYEHTETPVSQATDEILIQKEENPTLDVPKAESEDAGKESGYEVKEHLAEEPSQPSVQTEQESGKCSSVSEVTNVSNGEQSSDLGLETEKIEDRKPLDSTDLGETESTWKGGEKAIQEEENLAKNLAKPESLKEHTEIGKEETELPTGAQVQIPEVVNVNEEAKNVELALAGIEEKLKSESEPVAEVQGNEALPESSKSQADETSTDVHSQESEKQIKEDILQDEDYISSEQNANEVTKAVILSKVVDNEVDKVDDSEDIKEHAIEEESSTNEIHSLSKGNETINVEIVDKDEAKVIKRDPDTVCISKEQIDEAEKSLTSNADESKKIESPVDVDHLFEDKGTEQDAETKQSLTAEELETSSEYSTPRVETIVEDDISSPTALKEEKPDKQLQTSVSALPSEDEEIRTAPPTEKIEQEIQKDAEIKHESPEDFSDTKATEDVSFQEEDQWVPKAVSEEETIADQGLRKEEPEEQIQTTSSTLTSFEEREHETEAITTKPDEITGEQTLSANKPEEGTTSSALLSKEPEGESICRVKKTQEEKIKEAKIPDKISEDSSDAKKTAEICLERELEGANKDESAAAAAQALQVGEPNEQSLTSPSELPTENTVLGTTANVNEVEEEKAKEVEMLEKQRPQEPDSVVDQEITVAQASITEKSVEIETISTVEKPQKEKRQEAENLENEKCEDSPARETEDICLQKEEPNKLQALTKEEITSAVTSEELKHESKKTEDAKTNKEEAVKDEIREDASDARTTEETCSQKERSTELEAVVEEQVQNPTSALPSKEEECENTSTVPVSFQVQEDEALVKDENDSSQTLQMEKSEEQIPEPLVTLSSDEHKHETFSKVDKTEEEKVKEEEIQNEDSNGAKTVEGIGSEKDDTRGPQAVLEGEAIASQVIEEEPQGHGTLKEVKEIKEAETQEEEKSPQSECPRELQGAIEIEATAAQTQPRKEGNEIILNEVSKEEVMEDKEVTEMSYSTPHSEELTKGGPGEDGLKDKQIEDKTNQALESKCQTEELVVEAQKTNENKIIEKQIIFEDRTVGNPGQPSVASIETATVPEEISHQPEETTNIASDKQIPRESDPIENTGISSPIVKDIAAESSQKAEVESSTKETFQPEEQSPAPSSKLSSEEENGVETKADSVVEKVLKEVGTLEKDSSGTKTGEEMCLAKEENRELKAVQTPATEIQDPVSHFDDGRKEDELKDEDTGVLSVETLKDGANNNIEKEIVAEDKTVKDLEEASVGMKEATIVSEEAPAKADPIESSTTSSISKEHFPTVQRERALEASEKPEVGDLEPGKAQQISSEAGTDHGEEKRTDNSGVEITQEPAPADSGKLSLSDLLLRSTGEKMQVVEHVIQEGQTESKEEQQVEAAAETIQVKEVKTEDEKDGEEGDEHNKTDSGPDAPVMVEAPRDTETKPHKKSHNILSGVGSKVKHSISKVKKAITGKSSHSKESKPISPKESEK